jgi:hypothetical protein
MALLVLAYPEISKVDYERIQTFRQQYDPLYYTVVEPQITLIFPVTDWTPDKFTAEVQKQTVDLTAINICLRCAVLNKDAFSDTFHTFLVPDEGYGAIVRLHDRLYADKLFPNRALAVDFIPHMGIGNSLDPLVCLDMVRGWNQQDFAIAGYVTALDVVNYEDDQVETLERILLEKQD